MNNFLHSVLRSSISEPFSVKNSYYLVNKLNGVILDPKCELYSLDVVSLFTNVFTCLVMKGIERKWESISHNVSIPKEEFLLAIRMILTSTYFSFNNMVYKQTLALRWIPRFLR